MPKKFVLFMSNCLTDKKINICIITSVHPVFDVRIFHKQAKSLARNGYDVTLIAVHDKEEVVSCIKILPLPRLRNRIWRMVCLPPCIIVRVFRLRPAIIHFHDPELLMLSSLFKLFLGSKIIYDVHENIPAQILGKGWIPFLLMKPTAILYQLVERCFLPFVDRIILAEDSYTEIYKKYRNNLVRNYPLAPYFSDNSSFVRAKNTYDTNLIYIGGITRQRGALELILALEIVRDTGFNKILLRLVGRIDSFDLEMQIKNMITEYRLTENILLCGVVPHESLKRVLLDSDIGLCVLQPVGNYFESLPTKMFEYMAAGLPVIVSNFPLLKKIIENEKCGLTVNPLDPQEISQAIIQLINNPDEAKKMGERGRNAVQGKYNWGVEEKKLLDVYEKLLN